MPSHRLPNWLDQRAVDRAAHPALIADGEMVTYAELARRVTAAAATLRQCGVRSGDRVALLLPNGAGFAVAMHALMRLGAVLVPLDRRLSDAELHARMADARIALLVYGPADAGREPVQAALRRGAAMCAEDLLDASCFETPLGSGSKTAVGSSQAHGPRQESPLPHRPREAGPLTPTLSSQQCGKRGQEGAHDDSPASIAGEGDGDAPHAIVYTSGSSGRAKGVVLTYANHLSSAVGSARVLRVDPDDRWLACLPFCHVGGLSIPLRSVIYGTTAVIHDGFDPQRVHRAIDDDRVTIVSVVATMLQRLLDARGGKPYPPWLRCILLGGGPAPRALLEACAAYSLPVAQTYGMTEAASQIATLAPRDARRKLGSAGRPLFGTEIRVIDAHGRGVPAGHVGEIQVRGPTVTPGYWSGGERGKEQGPFLADGWFATGDLGRLDDDGFLYVVGRRDDLIISGGENVYPTEVEAALHAHPAVAEACVAGVPDPEWGSTVIAWVRLRPGASATEAELRAQVRATLAAFKVPRRVTVVDDFPRTASGKILRSALRTP